MRLRKSDEPLNWGEQVDVVHYMIVDYDGYYMMMQFTKELLCNPVGRKLAAADLRQMRKEIIKTRGTRARPPGRPNRVIMREKSGPQPFTVYVKISGENRVSGAWFYDKEVALKEARPWECVVPVTIDLFKDIAHE